MSRLHIQLSVDDLEQNIRFYSALFGAAPGVSKDDYARWDLAEPAVNFAISSRGARPGLDHVGIQSAGIDRSASIRMTGTGGALKRPKIFSGLLMTNILAIKKHKYSA